MPPCGLHRSKVVYTVENQLMHALLIGKRPCGVTRKSQMRQGKQHRMGRKPQAVQCVSLSRLHGTSSSLREQSLTQQSYAITSEKFGKVPGRMALV